MRSFTLLICFLSSPAFAAKGAERSWIGELLGWEEKLCKGVVTVIDPNDTVASSGGLAAYYAGCGFGANDDAGFASVSGSVAALEETIVLQWAMERRIAKLKANRAQVDKALKLPEAAAEKQDLLARLRVAAIDLAEVDAALATTRADIQSEQRALVGPAGPVRNDAAMERLKAAQALAKQLEAARTFLLTQSPLLATEQMKAFLKGQGGSDFFDPSYAGNAFAGFHSAVNAALGYTSAEISKEITKGKDFIRHPSKFFQSDSAATVVPLIKDPDFQNVGFDPDDPMYSAIHSNLTRAKCRLNTRVNENEASRLIATGLVQGALIVATFGVGSPFVAGASLGARAAFIGINAAGIALDVKQIKDLAAHCKDLERERVLAGLGASGDAERVIAECRDELGTTAVLASVGIVSAAVSIGRTAALIHKSKDFLKVGMARKAAGIPLGDYLGQGQQGTAFMVAGQPDKVVKIRRMMKSGGEWGKGFFAEAENAKYLKSKGIPVSEVLEVRPPDALVKRFVGGPSAAKLMEGGGLSTEQVDGLKGLIAKLKAADVKMDWKSDNFIWSEGKWVIIDSGSMTVTKTYTMLDASLVLKEWKASAARAAARAAR